MFEVQTFRTDFQMHFQELCAVFQRVHFLAIFLRLQDIIFHSSKRRFFFWACMYPQVSINFQDRFIKVEERKIEPVAMVTGTDLNPAILFTPHQLTEALEWLGSCSICKWCMQEFFPFLFLNWMILLYVGYFNLYFKAYKIVGLVSTHT